MDDLEYIASLPQPNFKTIGTTSMAVVAQYQILQ